MTNFLVAELDYYYLRKNEPNQHMFEGVIILDRDVNAAWPTLFHRVGSGLCRQMQRLKRNLTVTPPQQRESMNTHSSV